MVQAGAVEARQAFTKIVVFMIIIELRPSSAKWLMTRFPSTLAPVPKAAAASFRPAIFL
jgi:hypothetical protein